MHRSGQAAPSAPASSASPAPDGLPAMKCHTLRGQPWSPPPTRRSSPAEARKLLDTIDTGPPDRGPGPGAALRDALQLRAGERGVGGCVGRTISGRGAAGGSGSTRRAGSGTTCRPTTRAAAALAAYVEAAGLEEPKATLFQTVDPASRWLDGPGARAAGWSWRSSGAPPPRSSRRRRAATRSAQRGSTAYLSNGGTREHAQQIAGHASPKTTKLYDRTADPITVDGDHGTGLGSVPAGNGN